MHSSGTSMGLTLVESRCVGVTIHPHLHPQNISPEAITVHHSLRHCHCSCGWNDLKFTLMWCPRRAACVLIQRELIFLLFADSALQIALLALFCDMLYRWGNQFAVCKSVHVSLIKKVPGGAKVDVIFLGSQTCVSQTWRETVSAEHWQQE